MEYLEIESHLRAWYLEEIAPNRKMYSLRAYDLGCQLTIPKAEKVRQQMPNLFEIILVYPKKFTADNLFA